jgi:hypothetical protein
MAPREPPTPRGPAHSHQRRNAVDEDILARTGRAVRADQAQESSEETRPSVAASTV